MLAVRGVSYLVGEISEDRIRHDLNTIADELSCTAVMLIGSDPTRLVHVGRLALRSGLDVYLRPNVPDMKQPDLLDHLDAVAQLSEELRTDFPDRVTLLVGSEFSHTAPGIVPGPRSFLRLELILRFSRLLKRRINRRLDTLLAATAATARRRFHGPITYAAAGWETVDWARFDLVGVSLYRSRRNESSYSDRLRNLVQNNCKPVVITEFGCGAFTGADQRGAGSFQIVNWFATPPRVRGEHPRDEAVQARYLGELIEEYDTCDVHGCFVFTYVMPDFPRDKTPELDLDKAGFGIIATHPDGTTRPKQAFHEVARQYRMRR